MFRGAICFLIAFAAFGAPPLLQVAAQFSDDTRRAVPLSDGRLLILETTRGYFPISTGSTVTPRRVMGLSLLDSAGNSKELIPPDQFGHGNGVPEDAALDNSGNIWIVGSTDSDDFPLVNPLPLPKPAYRSTSFVVKMDPTGSKILFSTFLGGNQYGGFSSAANGIALDAAGNAYILGTTNEPDFPINAGVIGSGKPGSVGAPGADFVYTFLVKLSPEGHLISSLLLGANRFNCSGGSHCAQETAKTVGTRVVLGRDGNLTVAGRTNAVNFPVTRGAYQTTCICTDYSDAGFVAKVSSNGGLIWSTYFSDTASGNYSSVSINSLAMDSGGVYIAGTVYGSIPTTPGTVQPTPDSNGHAFAAKLSPDGKALSYSTYLGGSGQTTLSGLTLDTAGNVWIAGGNHTTGQDFAQELNAGASALTQSYLLPGGTVTQSLVFDSNGNLVLLAQRATVVRLSPEDGLSGTAILGFGNAASLQLGTKLVPGELATIFGVGLGPAAGLTGVPDANGVYPTELGGVRVLFGGVAAPLLYVGQNQINFQFPFLRHDDTLQVVTSTAMTQVIVVSSKYRSIGLFGGVLNQDGSVNSASNPAKAGSVVSLFATGLDIPYQPASGALWGAALPLPFGNLQAVSLYGGVLPILYEGTAPGLINGVAQFNVLLPRNANQLTLSLQDPNSSEASNSVPVYVQ